MGENVKPEKSLTADATDQKLERNASVTERLSELILAENFDAIPDDTDTNEALAAPEIKDAIRTAIGNACQAMDTERLGAIVKRCKPPDAEYLVALTNAFVGTLDTDAPLGARMLMWVKDYPGVFTPKVLNAANQAILRELNLGHVAVGADILEALQAASSQRSGYFIHQFPIEATLKEFFISADGRAALKTGLLKSLLANEPTERLIGYMQPSDVQSAKTEATKTRMQLSLDSGDVEEFLRIQAESRDVRHDDVARMLCRTIVQNVKSGHVHRAMEIATGAARDLLPRRFMQSDEVLAAGTEGVAALLGSNDIHGAEDIRKKLRVPDRYLLALVKQAVVRELTIGNYEGALDTLDTIQIYSYQIAKISEDSKLALLRVLQDGNRKTIERFNWLFEVSEEVLIEPEIQEAARRMLEGSLAEIGSIRDVLHLVEKYRLKKGPVTPATRASATKLVARDVGSGLCYMDSVREVTDFFDLSQEDLRSAAQEAVRHVLSHSTYPRGAYGIVDDFGLHRQEVQDIAIQTTTNLFRGNDIGQAFGVMDAMQIDPKDIAGSLDDIQRQELLEKMLTGDQSALVLRFMDAFQLSEEIVHSPDVHEAAVAMVERTIQYRLGDALAIAERLALRKEELQPLGYRALYSMLAEGRGRYGITMIKKFHLSRENALEILGSRHPVLIFFDDVVPQTIRYAVETYAEGVTFEHQRSRLTHRVDPDAYRRIIEHDPGLREDTNPEHVFDVLLDLPQEGEESVEIRKAMRAFAEMFGKDTALRFANRPDLSHHDAFTSVDALRKFVEINDLDQGETMKYFRELHLQVAMDDKQYETGTANHEWSRVIRQLTSERIETVISTAEATDIQGLRARAAKLRTARFDPLRSWRGLRDCAEVAALLEKRDLLEIFANETLPPRVRAYAEILLGHPTIDLEALRQLLLQPEEFFARGAAFVDGDRQEEMSPANLVSQPRLALSVEEVRDALVDGRLDALQEILPHDATFFFDQDGANIGTETYLRNAFLRAIGQQKLGIKGEAADPKALFHALRQFSSGIPRNMIDWLLSPLPTDTPLASHQLGDLRALLHGQLGVKPLMTHEVRVRVGEKSDAEVLTAMNDAASCMPFGDGKTNVYLWNPNCAFLVVERRTDEGWRTMAQSVLMKDIDIGRSAKEAIDRLKTATPMHDVLGAESFTKTPVLTCDNIEPSASEISAGRMALIEHAYRAFLSEYLRAHAEGMGVDPTRVIIGKETYDTRRPAWGFETLANTFLPAAPISYCDNNGADSYIFRTGTALPENSAGTHGVVSPIRASDALELAYAEGKSFDNAAMIVGLYKIQHRIVGQALSQEIHADPNLSFISRNKEGRPAGYILAGLDRSQEKPEVYIADFAVDQSLGVASARHAIKVLDTFLESFMARWQNAKIIPDIVAEMREKTSYKLLQRQGKKIAHKFGLSIRINAEGSSTLGGETIHHVRISIER